MTDIIVDWFLGTDVKELCKMIDEKIYVNGTERERAITRNGIFRLMNCTLLIGILIGVMLSLLIQLIISLIICVV